MTKPHENCQKCPLAKAAGPIWGEGSPHAKLVVIGQNPGPTEIEEGRPFAGGSGKVLDMTLQKSGIFRSDCFVTNVVKCFHLPGQPLPEGAVKCCAPLLEKELQCLRTTSTILTLGQEAFDSITGKELSLRHNRKGAEKNPRSWLRGTPFEWSRFIIVPAVHPSFVMRTGFVESPLFQMDVRKAVGFAEGRLKLPHDELIDNPTDREVEEYADEAVAKGAVGIDIETPEVDLDDDDLDPLYEVPIEQIGISHTIGQSLSIRPGQFHLLQTLLDHPRPNLPRLWGHNSVGFDFFHLQNTLKSSLRGCQLGDSMLAFYMLWSHLSNFDIATAQSVYSEVPYYKNWRKLNPQLYDTVGNCRDTYTTLQIGEECLRHMQSYPIDMRPLFWNHMMGLNHLVTDWRVSGVRIDVNEANRQLLILFRQLKQYEEWWDEHIPNFSWSSPKQLISLFSAMKLPIIKKKRPNGGTSPCCDDEVLELYATKHGNKTAQLVRTMREIKHAGDYLQMHRADGRVHPRVKPHAQVGGRIQLTDGNLQVVPETLSGTYPRRTILPDDDDSVIIQSDFSQIELRLYVKQSGAKRLNEMLASGDYIHGAFYEEIWKELFFNPGSRSKDNRAENTPAWKLLVAKSWPLGFIYGRGIPDVGGLPIVGRVARDLHDTFHRDNPEIKVFHNELLFRAARNGYLQTPYGRLRHFPNPKGQRNEILSFPGQVTAVDVLVGNALLPLQRGLGQFEQDGRRARLLFSVHDSVVVSCPKKHALDCHDFMKGEMERPLAPLDGLIIPVELKIGPNWQDGVARRKYVFETTTKPTAVPQTA